MFEITKIYNKKIELIQLYFQNRKMIVFSLLYFRQVDVAKRYNGNQIKLIFNNESNKISIPWKQPAGEYSPEKFKSMASLSL